MAEGSPFFTTWGPRAGPIRFRAVTGPLGVYEGVATGEPAGVAMAESWEPDGDRPPIALFRLIVRGEVLPGRYRCVGRAFVRADVG